MVQLILPSTPATVSTSAQIQSLSAMFNLIVIGDVMEFRFATQLQNAFVNGAGLSSLQDLSSLGGRSETLRM